jgi:hypothetical protein
LNPLFEGVLCDELGEEERERISINILEKISKVRHLASFSLFGPFFFILLL